MNLFKKLNKIFPGIYFLVPIEALVLELVAALLAEEVEEEGGVDDVLALQPLVVVDVLFLRLGAHRHLALRQAPLVAPRVAEDLLHLSAK